MPPPPPHPVPSCCRYKRDRGGKGESRHEHSSRVSWYVASRTLKIQLKPCQAPEKLHYLPWIQPVESMWCKQLPWGHFFQGLSSMALISQPPLQQSPVKTCTSEIPAGGRNPGPTCLSVLCVCVRARVCCRRCMCIHVSVHVSYSVCVESRGHPLVSFHFQCV